MNDDYSKKLSVVVPMYCEEDVVEPLYARLAATVKGLHMAAEFVFVDDGSRDATLERLHGLAARDNRVMVVSLSRNFGLSAAVTAGLDHARGDAMVVMDGDLQDPPELIPRLVEKWREGYDVVNAVKRRRPESLPKRLAFGAFYKIMQGLTDLSLPEGCGLFSLMDARVAAELGDCRERRRFIPGLRWWLGFRQCCVPFDRGSRYDEAPRQSLRHLTGLALDGILSFTSRPLHLAFWLGMAVSLLCIVGVALIVYTSLFTAAAVPGWASNMVTTLFVGGVQLVVLGVIGQYVGRIYEETRARPLYVVQSVRRGNDSPDPVAERAEREYAGNANA